MFDFSGLLFSLCIIDTERASIVVVAAAVIDFGLFVKNLSPTPKVSYTPPFLKQVPKQKNNHAQSADCSTLAVGIGQCP
jgi:hypothetical protein